MSDALENLSLRAISDLRNLPAEIVGLHADIREVCLIRDKIHNRASDFLGDPE